MIRLPSAALKAVQPRSSGHESPGELVWLTTGEHSRTGRALGTNASVVLTGSTQLELAGKVVKDVVDGIDRTCSRFRPDSEISRVEDHAGRHVTVSPLLTFALHEALKAAEQTDGLVDPTVGRTLIAAGYEDDFARVNRFGGAVHTSPFLGCWRAIELDPHTRTLRLPEGVHVDLGATAKALAADLAASRVMAALGSGGVLINLGGDVAVAGTGPTGGWRIQISDDSTDPMDPQAEHVLLTEGGVATSSTRIRAWRRDGHEMHHIIDPRTGRPAASPWRLVTVIGRSCLDANVAATAAIIMGDSANRWLRDRELAGRLVHRSGRVIRTPAWQDALP